MLLLLLLWLCASGALSLLPHRCFALIHLIKLEILLDLLQLLDCHHNTGAGQANNASCLRRALFPAALFTDHCCYSSRLILLLSGVSQPLTSTWEQAVLIGFFSPLPFLLAKKQGMGQLLTEVKDTHARAHTRTQTHVPHSDFIRSLHWDYGDYGTLHLLSRWLEWWSWWGLLQVRKKVKESRPTAETW